MKRTFLILSLLLGLLFGIIPAVHGQDTLLNFDDVEFSDGQDTTVEESLEVPDDVVFTDGQDTTTEGSAVNTDREDEVNDAAPRTLWGIFIAGIIGGFAAFLMPCIYPMVPLTVSFFTKQSGTRVKGIINALLYGLFIIVIYVALGMLVTLVFGASALNEAASSAWFNLLFFAIIILFAISFLGAFEITLPSRFVNKMDEKSNRGGLLGLFFMAFTLALVSFSCTGPIIGYLLVEAVSKGALMGPAMGMLGFSVALAIPFMLFAFFPSWLKEMPKSGGWLNTVKVSLGFLELALAFKFLSNVDLAYHWGILDREVFLAIWIVIFALFGFYLLGKLKFSHDSSVGFISIPRLFLAIMVLSFTVYMVPGMWGAPLKALSAWLPPSPTQDFNLHQVGYTSGDPQQSTGIVKKYGDVFHAPHGIDAFYDYDQALEYSRQVNKPVLLDFTGWSCVNCRKMEESVWPDPQVLKRLKEDYILVSLYVDDRTTLEPSEQYVSEFSGKKINTVGRKWSDLQASRFGTNAQPYYVIVDGQGKQLVPAQAYKEDIPHYIKFLDSGLAAFKANTPN
ncbi:protein-disulfide reductase DsbD family protein [Parapedobacter tibetensis]|uniref:protein-disulfide reductase DsbD family protein n=1 Tax=Parapedobacter tibetensis TaxID=2972951 RepID=UPI00214DCFE1|nr:thioredoxin family protein [Parapedobacter tibetensis]